MYTIFKFIHVQYVIYKVNKHNIIDQYTQTLKTVNLCNMREKERQERH